MKLEELNGQSFDSKTVIKPWLHSKLVPLGIHVVIARSDDSKIVFKCRSQIHSKTGGGCLYGSATASSRAAKGIGSSAAVKKKSCCPFRIRANYSVRAQKWSLVVINGAHNHTLEAECGEGGSSGVSVGSEGRSSSADSVSTLAKPTLTLRQAPVLDTNVLPPLVPTAMSPSTSCGSIEGEDMYNHSYVRISNEQYPIARTKYSDVLNLLATLNASALVSEETRDSVYEGMLKALREVVPKCDVSIHHQHAPIVLPSINHLTPPSDNNNIHYNHHHSSLTTPYYL